MDSIYACVAERAAVHPAQVALQALGGADLTYGALYQQVQEVGRVLRRAGVGPADTVAVVLPNGPEMAAAFVGVASFACCAPLNPAYREAELSFYLSDLKARAILVEAHYQGPVRTVAATLGMPMLELAADRQAGAGRFSLQGLASDGTDEVPNAPDHIALALHTSGTTSRPKLVPLSHRNVCASARNIGQTLRLSSTDRCLNVMPLFHIHGLMAALLASIRAGASVVCTPGFLAPRFFEWMHQFRPTWYTAVPTMHQAILARADEHQEVIAANPLRFIRSSSASLAPDLLRQLETTFKAPVIEAYGMTEASHQMTSNPLPPAERRPGSVGQPAGPEVAIMDEANTLLPADAVGEVVIRGENVTTGYAANPEANAQAFVDGWFRTGDQGYQTSDGYLFLTGRLKEMINRGGESIAPREIDEVLLAHPAVAQALAFALPDARLGEAVAAAVVLRDGQGADESTLRRFVATRLSDAKVPQRIVFLDAIPKGPTGKLQRIGFAERLGLTEEPVPESAPSEYIAPETPMQTLVADLWREVLRQPTIGIHNRFLDVGGDSMLAAQLMARVQETMAMELTALDFFDAPTIATQAALLEHKLMTEE